MAIFPFWATNVLLLQLLHRPILTLLIDLSSCSGHLLAVIHLLTLVLDTSSHNSSIKATKFTCCHFLSLHNIIHPKIQQMFHEIEENVFYTWRNERIFSGCCYFLMIFRGLERGSSTVKGAGSHLGNLHFSCSFYLLGKRKKKDKHGSIGESCIRIDVK